MMPTVKVFIALGNLAWTSIFATLTELGEDLPRPRPKFGHGERTIFIGNDGIKRIIIASYHPSQQNTFTGKLTQDQLNLIMKDAAEFI